jgi:hypothetical protein
MLVDIMDFPEEFLESLQRYSNSLITTMVFGRRSPFLHDPMMEAILKGLEDLTALGTSPMAILLDCYPMLRRLPDFLLPLKRKADSVYRSTSSNYLFQYDSVKNNLKSGKATPSFSVYLAKAQEKEGFTDVFAAYLAGNLIEAGTETTSSTIYAFLQAMVVWPEVLSEAQKELDRVCGEDRMPTMEDEPQLQYIRGCVKESLRWMPTAITGAMPHALIQDDEYMGYKLPKGTSVVNNVYSINIDPQRYPEPRRFNPSRYTNDFLNSAEAATISDVSKRDHFTFSAGRRLCQKMHAAERSLFLAIANLAWGFDITAAIDDKGVKVIPDIDSYTPGFVVMPTKFPAVLTPRSSNKAEIMRNEWRKAQQDCLDPVSRQWKV